MIKDVFTCWGKDFKFYFQSKMLYFALGFYLIISVLFTFYLSDFYSNTSVNLYQFFAYQPIILALIIPALAMRLWSDEYKYNTWEVLFSQPIQWLSVVLGKFLAIWSIVGIMILSSFLFWGLVSLWINTETLWVVSNFVVTFLMAGSLCALASMMTAFYYNVVSAFLGSISVCLLFVLADLGGLVSKILTNNVMLTKLFSAFDLKKQFEILIMGQLNLSAIIYFLLIIVFALTIERIVIEYKRM